MPAQDMPRRRRDRLVKLFKGQKIDALLVSSVHNVRYLTGFQGDDSMLLVTPQKTFLLTDFRYTEQAGQETKGIEIVTRKRPMMRTAGTVAKREGATRLGVEAGSLTLAQAEELKKWIGHGEVVSTSGLVETLRIVKDATEIEMIRRAAEIAEDAFRRTLPQVKAGMTEIQIAQILDRAMMELGADAPAFPTIVAATERASLPHARPTERVIRSGDAILFDWGARFGLYHSDLTRVAFVDRISPIYRRIYSVVLTAQRRAVAQVKPGRKAAQIDAVARDFLKARRHGKHFGHGLGHGVGLEVHEAPALARGQDVTLRAGMVVTVEPGVYLPGCAGVRIEDLLLVTRQGHVSLTSLPRSPESFLIRS